MESTKPYWSTQGDACEGLFQGIYSPSSLERAIDNMCYMHDKN